MKTKICNFLLFSAIYLPLAGQIRCFEVNDTIMPDTVLRDKQGISAKIEYIGIIEPFVYKNIPAVKNIILSTIKNEIANQFKYEVLKNDSLIIATDLQDFSSINRFFAQRDTFDAFMIINQGFTQINYQNYSGTINPEYETRILISVFNKQGTLLARSYDNTDSAINTNLNQNVMKKLEKATKKTIDSVIDQLKRNNDSMKLKNEQ